VFCAKCPFLRSCHICITDLGLLYGVIFGTLLIACAVLVVVILALKYIQMTRRDTDKVINHREKQQETFRRLSLQRSSVSSIKKSPLPDHKTNGNIYMWPRSPSNMNPDITSSSSFARQTIYPLYIYSLFALAVQCLVVHAYMVADVCCHNTTVIYFMLFICFYT